MKLKDWLALYNLSVHKFCRYHNLCRESIYAYLKGRIPRSDVAKAIVRATREEVSLEDLGLSKKITTRSKPKKQKPKKQKPRKKKGRHEKIMIAQKMSPSEACEVAHHNVDKFLPLKHRVEDYTNKKESHNMSTLHAIAPNILEELEESIARAMDRVNVKKETDLCLYLPGKGGRLHHFVFGKMKKTQPIELLKMIKEHILEKDAPKAFSSKPKPGLMVKRQVEVRFKRSQINRLVDILKKAGEQELISMLAPHQTLAQVQKLMLDMIKEKEIDQGLWETYVRLVEEERAILQQQ